MISAVDVRADRAPVPEESRPEHLSVDSPQQKACSHLITLEARKGLNQFHSLIKFELET